MIFICEHGYIHTCDDRLTPPGEKSDRRPTPAQKAADELLEAMSRWVAMQPEETDANQS